MMVSPLLQEEEKYLELDSRSESAMGNLYPQASCCPLVPRHCQVMLRESETCFSTSLSKTEE